MYADAPQWGHGTRLGSGADELSAGGGVRPSRIALSYERADCIASRSWFDLAAQLLPFFVEAELFAPPRFSFCFCLARRTIFRASSALTFALVCAKASARTAARSNCLRFVWKTLTQRGACLLRACGGQWGAGRVGGGVARALHRPV